MGSKGLGGHARIRGGGGGGGGRGYGPHRKITRYMGRSRSKPLPHLAKFLGSAHGGIYYSGMHYNRLPNGGPGSGGDSIPARGLELAKIMAFTWLR